MEHHALRAALMGAAALLFVSSPLQAQHEGHGAAPQDTLVHSTHGDMWMWGPADGWRVMGMAQAFPIVTFGAPGATGSPLNDSAFYLTQPAAMVNLESPGSRVVFRTTLNFEGITLEDGEFTFGGWGEGFLDKRHPHTLLHEMMLSLNLWDVAGGTASISAGKGFAPYGTDDPMARPELKYPTNHHLSQILERWTVNLVYLNRGWSAELGVFGGNEPDGAYDLSNIDSFGNSVSGRLARRWGAGVGPMAEWEASASLGRVVEAHHGEEEATTLWNVALRRAGTVGGNPLYGLLEFSQSHPEHGEGYFSALGEMQVTRGRHQPYARLEYATRPEYPRDGAPGSPDFFLYDHDAEALGSTRWMVANLGYNFLAVRGPVSIRPFVNAQFHRVALESGPPSLEPLALFGEDQFWSFSFGARIFLGGDPMRMGSYGVLDAMTGMHRGGMDHSGMHH